MTRNSVHECEGQPAPATAAVADTAAPNDRSALERAVVEGREPHWEELLELAKQVGPSARLAHLDDRGLERELRVGAARLAAQMCQWLDLLAELVVRGVWADQGAKTPAQWLSWAVGLAPATARDQVRVALRLRELARIREVFAAGRISYSKVRALTRVAVPELEEQLLTWADRATAAELESAVRGFRRAQRGRLTAPVEVERRRAVRVVDRFDGTSDLVITLPTDEALSALADLERLAALEAGTADPAATPTADPGATPTADPGATPPEPDGPPDPDPAATPPADPGATPPADPGATPPEPDGPPDPDQDRTPATTAEAASAAARATRSWSANLADAAVQALAAAVADGPTDTTGEDLHTLVVHLGPDDLEADGEAVGVDTSVGRAASMGRRTLRRLACDAGLLLVATDDEGTPIDVGRRERRLSAALRRALRARDHTCRFPGCGTTRHLHAHHIWHWGDGGPTDLSNLVLLCSFHHRFVHDNELDVDLRPGGAHIFRRHTGQRLPRTRPLDPALAPGDVANSGAPALAQSPPAIPDDEDPGAHDQPATALQPTYWDGPGHFDLDTTVAVLQQEFEAVLPAAAVAA